MDKLNRGYIYFVCMVSAMGGLLFGTLITLLFIPVLYAMFFGIKNRDEAKKS